MAVCQPIFSDDLTTVVLFYQILEKNLCKNLGVSIIAALPTLVQLTCGPFCQFIAHPRQILEMQNDDISSPLC